MFLKAFLFYNIFRETAESHVTFFFKDLAYFMRG